jgi:hypothetical protein
VGVEGGPKALPSTCGADNADVEFFNFHLENVCQSGDRPYG